MVSEFFFDISKLAFVGLIAAPLVSMSTQEDILHYVQTRDVFYVGIGFSIVTFFIGIILKTLDNHHGTDA